MSILVSKTGRTVELQGLAGAGQRPRTESRTNERERLTHAASRLRFLV
jgi:hypothetical protein